MALIYETANFIIEAVEKPHIDRNEGGHIRIFPKSPVPDRQALSPLLAIELTRLTTVVGDAMGKAMIKQGVDIGRINYHDMGNWAYLKKETPYFHIHVYGRAKDAKIQKWGHSVYLPWRGNNPEFYENFKPLSKEDISCIRSEIERLLTLEKYSDKAWKLE